MSAQLLQLSRYVPVNKIVQQELIEELTEKLVKKKHVFVRLSLNSAFEEFHFTRVPRTQDKGRIITFRGTVIRTGLVKMLELEKQFKCQKCGEITKSSFDIYQYNIIPRPACCKAKLIEIKDLKETKDYQEIRIQEQVSRLDIGTIPRTTNCILMDDLVDECKAGDDVTVTAIVIERWKRIKDNERLELEITLYANNIRVNNTNSSQGLTRELQEEFLQFWKDHENNPLKGRNKILSSFCPQVFGLYLVKLAVVLVLVGGVGKQEGGLKIRGDSHILLVGDSGEWQLEAGALVLADKGVCCIDEFGTIREQDKTAIHEAMEQQSISVAKAGLVCKLNTRCSIIAATNPKGKYDTRQNIEINTAIASPLLSRFDIILVLLDHQNDDWDDEIKTTNSAYFSIQKLSSYIDFVKQKQPQLTKNATIVLKNYYQIQRQKDFRNQARTTIRLLESLIRLSQAHAKLLCQDKVLVRDAVVAISVVEGSMQTSALNGLKSCFETFADDPDEEYRRMETDILISIGCGDLVDNHEFDGAPNVQPDFNYNPQPDFNFNAGEISRSGNVQRSTRINERNIEQIRANVGRERASSEDEVNSEPKVQTQPEGDMELVVDDQVSEASEESVISWEATMPKEKQDKTEWTWDEYQQSLNLRETNVEQEVIVRDKVIVPRKSQKGFEKAVDSKSDSGNEHRGGKDTTIKDIPPKLFTGNQKPNATSGESPKKPLEQVNKDLSWEEYLQKPAENEASNETCSTNESGLVLDLPDDPFASDDELSIPCNLLGSSIHQTNQNVTVEKKRKLTEETYDFENNDLFASQVSNFGLAWDSLQFTRRIVEYSSLTFIVNVICQPDFTFVQMYESTPLLTVKKGDNEFYLKLDNLQPSQSFKMRGISNCISTHLKQNPQLTTIISSSGGNAGLSATIVAVRLGLKVIVYCPTTTSQQTIQRLEKEGAQVVSVGQVWDMTHLEALKKVEELGEHGFYVHPFEHPDTWMGHSSIVSEIFSHTSPDIIICSVGGGGLLCGILTGLIEHKANTIVYCVETFGAHSLNSELNGHRLSAITSIAKSLGALKVSRRVFELMDIYGRDKVKSTVVSDKDALEAVELFNNEFGYLVEPACGASLHFLYKNDFTNKKVAIEVCGGFQVDAELITKWRQQV
ncbi:DNA helicase mcm9 [Terramyces sp. JEL0728]|nr:DNA helicase mcm9 [Terramyces sp. JEL0728]